MNFLKNAIRFERQTGLMLGKNGGSHVQKGIDMAKYIENKILTQDLSPSHRPGYTIIRRFI